MNNQTIYACLVGIILIIMLALTGCSKMSNMVTKSKNCSVLREGSNAVVVCEDSTIVVPVHVIAIDVNVIKEIEILTQVPANCGLK
jgi:hypothetical protein